jgi:manganese-dependent inorganic pyrophosphatase
MSEILVIGHRNPDTDAVCSAIGYAEFKRRTGLPQAEAARCGDTNERIDFVLKTFGMAAPRFVADVSPQVRDVMRRSVVSVGPQATAAEALALMDEANIRVLPVLNEAGVCQGLLSLFKLSKFLFPAGNRSFDSRRVLSSLNNLARTVGGKLLVAREPDREEELVLMIGAMGLESFAQRLAKSPRDRLAVVVGDRWDIQNLAIRERVRVVIVTGDFELEPETLKTAERNGVSIVVSPHDTATTASFCRASIAVNHVVHEQFVTFQEDQALSEARETAIESNFLAFPVLDSQSRTVGILSKSDFLKKVDRKLILVDHNELSQAVEGAETMEILEIIDHHRLGTIKTSQPILFRNEPVGSTSTIVADCFLRHGVELTPPMAGILLAGLVSDTLNLNSPTTTERDREILRQLEKIAEVRASEFTDRLFASGSVLTSRPAEQAITADCKEYQEDTYAFSVAQIEEIGFNQFWGRKDAVQAALESYRANKGFLFSALLVTDLVRQNSLLLMTGDPRVLQKIDYPKLEPGIFELHGVVSRKKQLLPYLTHCMQRLKLTAGPVPNG